MKILRSRAGEWIGDAMDGPPKYLVADVWDGVVVLVEREPHEADSDTAIYREAARIRRERLAKHNPLTDLYNVE
jgi:hypothetical protein